MYLREQRIAAFILAVGVCIAASVIVFGGVFSAAAQEQEADTDIEDEVATEAERDIIFPVAELGNCENKTACKTYCNAPEHMSACVAFAEAHGLMKSEEAAVARKFAQTLERGTGPGGCRGVASCKTYCENTDHIEECIAFAEEHGHTDQGIEEGKKIAAFLKSGGSMPGGCNSRQSCEAYCTNFDHFEECSAFAERAGLESHDEAGKPIDHERMRKIHELMKSGETPGKCDSKQSCEAYCQEEAHAEECLAFGERAGMMSSENAARARAMLQNGGPGGCRGQQACEAFCRVPENHETCVAFAKEKGFITGDDERRFREAGTMMREHFGPPGEFGGPNEDHASEVASCVRKKVQHAFESGNPPGQDIMQGVMRECAQQFGGGDGFGGEGFGDGMPGQPGFGGEGFRDEGMQNMPPERRMMPPKMMPRPSDDAEEHPPIERPMPPRESMMGDEYEKQFQQQYSDQYRQEYEHQYKEIMMQRMQEGGTPPNMMPRDTMPPGGMPTNAPYNFPQNSFMNAPINTQTYPARPSAMPMMERPDADAAMPPPTGTFAPQSNVERYESAVANVISAIYSLYGVH